jgi:hypothetical protein
MIGVFGRPLWGLSPMGRVTFRQVLLWQDRIVRRFQFLKNVEWVSRKIEIRSSTELSTFSAHSGFFKLPPPRVRVINRVSVAPHELEFSATYCPFRSQSPVSATSTRFRPTPRATKHHWVSSIFAREDWNRSYFHWHRNFLTHLVVLQDQGLNDVRVIVADKLPNYKLDSLLGLGVRIENIVPWSTVKGTDIENLVSVRNVDRQPHPYPSDFVRPSSVRSLSSRILRGRPESRSGEPIKLYVKRGGGNNRNVINEAEIIRFLLTEGFQAVDPGAMSYWEQVDLFSAASDIVAPHGGALTNVIFSSRPNLLEFAQAGHGVRPDFYQFVEALDGRYTMCVVPSENEDNDITIPAEVVRWWLSRKKAESNLVFTVDMFKWGSSF